MQRSYLSGPTGGGECQQYFTIYLRAPSYLQRLGQGYPFALPLDSTLGVKRYKNVL